MSPRTDLRVHGPASGLGNGLARTLQTDPCRRRIAHALPSPGASSAHSTHLAHAMLAPHDASSLWRACADGPTRRTRTTPPALLCRHHRRSHGLRSPPHADRSGDQIGDGTSSPVLRHLHIPSVRPVRREALERTAPEARVALRTRQTRTAGTSRHAWHHTIAERLRRRSESGRRDGRSDFWRARLPIRDQRSGWEQRRSR
jgi:hypothetical protein